MPPYILADTFLQDHKHQVTAVLSIVIAIVLATLVDRVILRHATSLASKVRGGHLSAEADTRVRFLRRMIEVTIIVIGIAVALAQFSALDRIAGTVLASGAIAAAVVGFASRQVLANAIAGTQLAITQPLRVGDRVTFEGETGTVEDVRLTTTWLRTPTDTRVIIPNERLAAGVLKNESIENPTVAVEVSVWLRPDDDAIAATDTLRDALPDSTVRVAETTAEGVRLLVIGSPALPSARVQSEADLRETVLRALR